MTYIIVVLDNAILNLGFLIWKMREIGQRLVRCTHLLPYLTYCD